MKEIYKKYMNLALKEAEKALKNNEVPVGAILVDENGEVVAKGYNKKEKTNDVTMHAEIVAIRKASKIYKNWRLNNLTLYVTLLPCLMCEGAIISSNIKKVVYGATDPNLLNHELVIRKDEYFNNKVELIGGIESEKSRHLLSKFFENKRIYK